MTSWLLRKGLWASLYLQVACDSEIQGRSTAESEQIRPIPPEISGCVAGVSMFQPQLPGTASKHVHHLGPGLRSSMTIVTSPRKAPRQCCSRKARRPLPSRISSVRVVTACGNWPASGYRWWGTRRSRAHLATASAPASPSPSRASVRLRGPDS